MIGFDGEVDLSVILIGFLLLFVLGGAIWYYLIEKPLEEKKNKNQYEILSKDKDLIFSGRNLVDKIEELSLKTPPCKKCNQNNFTIWEILPNTITIRCNHCKKKYSLKDAEINDGYVQALIHYHNKFFELLEIKNPLLDQYKVVPFDYSGLRKNQPLFQSYIFEAKGTDIKAKEETEVSNKGNRRIPRDIQDRVWRRDEGKCVVCVSKDKLEFDHIIPFSKGGANTYRNIQLLCEKCNREKSNRIG